MSENKDKKKQEPFKDVEFLRLKTTFKVILIILFIVLSMMLVFSIKGKAITQDINYTFDNDYIYNSNEGFDYNYFNIRNKTITIPQDNYTSTYDFLDDVIGGNPSYWVCDESGGSIDIIESLFDHNNVVDIYDTLDSGYNILSNNSFSQSSGTLEFWYYSSDPTYTSNIWIYDGVNTDIVYIIIDSDKIAYFDGSSHEIMSFKDNAWYTIRIDFECGLGSYEGLSEDTFYIYINNVKYGAYSMQGNPSEMDTIAFTTGTPDYNYHVYIDAIGLSWDNNYTIGQYLAIPNTTTTKIQEIDKCEFAYNLTTTEPNLENKKNIDNNWLEIDDSTNEHIKTFDPHAIIIGYYITQLQDTYGIYKEFGYNSDNIFNISFFIESISLFNPKLDGWYLNIYTYDDTLLVSLLIKASTGIIVYYYDGNSYKSIYSIPSPYWDIDFNIYINERVILRIKDSGNSYSWYFPELTTKIGINTIEVIGGHKDDIGDYADIEIGSIGLYINGSSYQADDYSSIIVNTDINQWDDNIHNLFEVNGIGNFSFSIFYDGSFQYNLFPYSEITTLKRVYAYNLDVWKGNSPYTFVLVSNTSIVISEIKVYSNILREGSNIYRPTYSNINVSITENYFYTVNNRLYFYLDLNSYSYEGIQISFDIPEHSFLNTSLDFRSYFSGHITPYLCVNYTYSEIDYFPFNNYPSTSRYLLHSNKFTDKLIINVSDYNPFQDNYTNHESGFISGYISKIVFNFIHDIDYTLTTMTLISGFIPLIVIFVPTIALTSKFGKKIIIPCMILMSIICFVSLLIPLWLFSISMLIFGFLVLVDKSEGI